MTVSPPASVSSIPRRRRSPIRPALPCGQPPLVQVFAPVIWGIPASPEVLEAVNDINLRIRFGRVMWTGREVIAGMELWAARILADDIGFACLQVGSIADHFDDELKLRFAGATMFGTTPGRPN
jgi:hypothetical protein